MKSDTIDLKTELNDVTNGRTTIKSIWKAIIRSTPTQEELMRRIEAAERETEDFQSLREYLLQYIPMVIFPKFKRDRGSLYFKFLIHFAEIQSTSSEKNIEIWTQVLEQCSKHKHQNEDKNLDESFDPMQKNTNFTIDKTQIKMEKARPL